MHRPVDNQIVSCWWTQAVCTPAAGHTAFKHNELIPCWLECSACCMRAVGCMCVIVTSLAAQHLSGDSGSADGCSHRSHLHNTQAHPPMQVCSGAVSDLCCQNATASHSGGLVNTTAAIHKMKANTALPCPRPSWTNLAHSCTAGYDEPACTIGCGYSHALAGVGLEHLQSPSRSSRGRL
eukprot:365702-Chlamydomonas_euryale.AAC.4